MAYIITPDSFVVEEKPYLMFKGFDGERTKTYAEIEEVEMPVCDNVNYYEYKPLKLTVSFEPCAKRIRFKMDTNMRITSMVIDNIRNCEFWLNDDMTNKVYISSEAAEGYESHDLDDIEIKDGDQVNLGKLSKYYSDREGKLTINGVDWTNVFDSRTDQIIGDEMEVGAKGN